MRGATDFRPVLPAVVKAISRAVSASGALVVAVAVTAVFREAAERDPAANRATESNV